MATDLTALEIFRDEAAEDVFRALAGRLLDLLSTAPGAPDEPRGASLRSQLGACREALGRDGSAADVARAAARSLELGQQLLAHCGAEFADREAELRALVDLLRGALDGLTGRSSTFNGRVQDASERFERLAALDDIREMRCRLTEEVGVLQQAVAEKRRVDEAERQRLSAHIARLEARVAETRLEALRDPLTGVGNRRRFDQAIARWIAAAGKGGPRFTLAMIDVDDFKRINDLHGHLIGDRVLACAAQMLQQGLRPEDLVARYGGEEFAILMAQIDVRAAERRLQSLIGEIAARRYDYADHGSLGSVRFTVSCGVAEVASGDTVDTLVARADHALRDAKKRGKNRVIARRRPLMGTLFAPRPSPTVAVPAGDALDPRDRGTP